MKTLNFKEGTISELIDALAKAQGYLSKEELAGRIGIAVKTVYNISVGEPIGLATKRRINRFLAQKYGVKMVETSKDRMILEPIPMDDNDDKTNAAVQNLIDTIMRLTRENQELKEKLMRLMS